MRAGRKNHARIGLVAACLVGLVAAATASAAVVIYANHFKNRGDVRELDRVARGEACDHDWRSRSETLQVVVKRGPEVCITRPALRSDDDQPNHIFRARFKVTRDTPKGRRDNAFIALEVRSAKNAGYQLRVFPKEGEWGLRRNPNGGPFPDQGTDPAINGINQGNTLELRAVGNTIKAFANGAKLTEITDPNPGEVGGRKVEAIIGQTGDSTRNVFAILDDLVLACPRSGC